MRQNTYFTRCELLLPPTPPLEDHTAQYNIIILAHLLFQCSVWYGFASRCKQSRSKSPGWISRQSNSFNPTQVEHKMMFVDYIKNLHFTGILEWGEGGNHTLFIFEAQLDPIRTNCCWNVSLSIYKCKLFIFFGLTFVVDSPFYIWVVTLPYSIELKCGQSVWVSD